MSSKTKRLGGMADLYQRDHLDGTVTKIKMHLIRPSNEQPRQDPKVSIEELAQSIERDGQLAPIVVAKEDNGKYRVIAGERRFHAISKLKWAEAECKILSRDSRDYWRIAIQENLQRKNLSAQDEAAAFLKYKTEGGLSDANLAKEFGKSRNYITEILSINNMPTEILAACTASGVTNKNILIQAAQAHKKGIMDEFLAAVSQGSIQTVRQAKSFNQGKTSDENGSKAPASGKTRNTFEININCAGPKIIIQCKTTQESEQLAHLIARKFNSTT